VAAATAGAGAGQNRLCAGRARFGVLSPVRVRVRSLRPALGPAPSPKAGGGGSGSGGAGSSVSNCASVRLLERAPTAAAAGVGCAARWKNTTIPRSRAPARALPSAGARRVHGVDVEHRRWRDGARVALRHRGGDVSVDVRVRVGVEGRAGGGRVRCVSTRVAGSKRRWWRKTTSARVNDAA
jgi:hypothetical protein